MLMLAKTQYKRGPETHTVNDTPRARGAQTHRSYQESLGRQILDDSLLDLLAVGARGDTSHCRVDDCGRCIRRGSMADSPQILWQSFDVLDR